MAVERILEDYHWHEQLPEILHQLGRSTNADCYFICITQVDFTGLSIVTSDWIHDPSNPPERRKTSSDPLDADVLKTMVVDTDPNQFSDEHFENQLRELDIPHPVVRMIKCSDQVVGLIGFGCRNPDVSWATNIGQMSALVAYAIGTAIDRRVTEQERIRYRSIMENSDDAIIVKSIDGKVIEWSDGAERIYGFTASEMVGRTIETIAHPDHRDDIAQIMARLRDGQRIDHYRTVRIGKDGREISVSVSITPITDQNGAVSGAVTVARDITEQEHAQLLLRASEERIRLALDAGEVGAWEWNILTGEVHWSENMERLHGLEPGSFKGTFDDYLRGVVPVDHKNVVSAIKAAVASRSDYEIEYRSFRADGSTQWLSARGRVIEDYRGRPARMTGICYDVTRRRLQDEARAKLLAQLELAHAEADAERRHLRELFEHAPAMLALLEGPDHVVTIANERFHQSIGNRDLIGRPISESLPEMAAQGYIELLDHVYQHGEAVVRDEMPVMIDRTHEGEPELRYSSFSYQPIRDAHGDVTGILVHAIDMTEHVLARRRIEELLRQIATERDRLQQVIDVMPEGIAISDRAGNIYLSNAVAQRIWGRTPPTGGIEDYGVFGASRPDGSPYPIEELPLSRSIRQGEVVLGEQLLLSNAETGEKVNVLVNSAPLLDASGEIIAGVVVFQDIGPLKEFEKQKDEFLQAVSHDLKNPLTTIKGYAQYLSRIDPSDTERHAAAVRNVDDASSRAISMLEEILDLTRLQLGRTLDLALSATDLSDLLKRLAEQHQIMTTDHQIIVESPESPIIGNWDRVRLERVFDNLLTNAVRYSPNGGLIRITAELESRDDESIARVSVQDFGLGIPETEMPHLFERFWRGSNVREHYRGSGLGLAGVKAIVEAHQGIIDVISSEDAGSTFIIQLPLESNDLG